jgi:hypothetical protein
VCSRLDSDQGPLRCERNALPTELREQNHTENYITVIRKKEAYTTHMTEITYSAEDVSKIAQEYGTNVAKWAKIEAQIRRKQGELKNASPVDSIQILLAINALESKLSGKRNFSQLPRPVRMKALQIYRSTHP